ncbi:MAG: glycerate kinase [Salinisphaeraceae bacterium]
MPDHPMRIVIAPDSFKGCLPASAVAASLAAGMQRVGEFDTHCLGLADGGEGSLDCVAAARPDARLHYAAVRGVHGRPVNARWLDLGPDGAFVESAEVLGLGLIDAGGRPPLAERGSAGLGQLLQQLLAAGYRRIAVSLGGSACNDGGLGLLLALGGQAEDAAGNPVTPDLAGLCGYPKVTAPALPADLSLTVLCDVDNPLGGPRGATRVYGPQKGLTPPMLREVERGLDHLARQLDAVAIGEQPGAGAAGGLGFALACLGGDLVAGAPAMLTLAGMEPLLAGAAAVLTGEGRADRQTLHGKLPVAVAELAAGRQLPALLVAGDIEARARGPLAERFRAQWALTDLAGNAESAQREAEHWLEAAGAEAGRWLLRNL